MGVWKCHLDIEVDAFRRLFPLRYYENPSVLMADLSILNSVTLGAVHLMIVEYAGCYQNKAMIPISRIT
ncbi:hypothetical protein C5167_021822 [Papaver somniferum]|uniref:Uncharacterized protein n=1 Tax=Papaver somniferum TaxID=3469 RepID=A0A4Y7JJ73_PAPSO|nr:hypothetical protein C5167_021822 [Papaver somniferum]